MTEEKQDREHERDGGLETGTEARQEQRTYDGQRRNPNKEGFRQERKPWSKAYWILHHREVQVNLYIQKQVSKCQDRRTKLRWSVHFVGQREVQCCATKKDDVVGRMQVSKCQARRTKLRWSVHVVGQRGSTKEDEDGNDRGSDETCVSLGPEELTRTGKATADEEEIKNGGTDGTR